jgi:L-threonylcarbamoyladenylate synthase
MIIIDYSPRDHRAIMVACAHALKSGKVVAFPTDTSYGLAVDATNPAAVIKLYKIKGRTFTNPVAVIIPSQAYAKKIIHWPKAAERLAKRFWPGPLTIALPLKKPSGTFKKLAGGTGSLGLRLPNYKIAQDLAKFLQRPITATSANISGKPSAYTADQVISQFSKQKFKPDILIDKGALPRRQVSTVITLQQTGEWQIVRPGPITEKQIKQIFTK